MIILVFIKYIYNATHKMDRDIRSKIIIPDKVHLSNVIHYSNIELAAIYSKNNNNFTILKLLLENNKTNIKINSILRQIVGHLDSTSSYDAANLLIDYGAEINECSIYGWSILTYACSSLKNIEIINFLIDNRSNVNVETNTETQPLNVLILESSNYDHFECIKLLIRKGGNVNFKDWHFMTPLMICFESKNNELIRYDIIKLLLDNKADVYIKNKYGENIFYIIKDRINKGDKQNCKNSDIYSLIFNYKNLEDEHLCESDINFIYYV